MSSSSQPVPRDSPPSADTARCGTQEGGAAHGQERRLHRQLGYWRLAGIGLGDIIGSGWLFAAMYAARIAGPLSLLCWLAGGALAALVALVMVDLGASRPEAGGTVRWPLYANGPLVAAMLGWAVLLAVGANAAEVAAIVQYLAHWRPQLYDGSRLTWSGVLLALAITVLLGVLNAFGVRLFARVNLLVTAVKLVVPVLTVVLLLVSARFEPGRLSGHGHGGFAPYGWSAGLTALSVGGIVYAFNGFQSPVEFSGEVRDPRRDVPRSVLTGLALAVVLYLGLQLAFLVAVPERDLAGGWQGVAFDSPFAELALLLNLHWLSMVMYADAVLSPGGSALVGLAATARRTYALAKNGTLPRWFRRVHAGSGIPRRALVLNTAITAMFLVPLGGWQDIVSTLGDLLLMVYATSAVAARTLRVGDPARAAGRSPALRWVAPLAFVVATLFVYWSAWHRLRVTVPLTLLGLPLFWVTRRGEPAAQLLRELRKGAWLIAWLLALLAFSAVGGFGGSNLVPKPYDSLAVGGCGLAAFFWGVRSGRSHLAETAG
ncbi:APC family permease [Kitasatospora sp. NBC_01250]|uniref:APC family permease n=1 Tax=unclassified Kitasatospora TaxID=2633591 RepID=UPI002E104322|nr:MULTISPECIES: APC family permease [unclassified Kitasatospora]WSJ66937.1 APC family permease [Kitasatospora sp. NBC_01302]